VSSLFPQLPIEVVGEGGLRVRVFELITEEEIITVDF